MGHITLEDLSSYYLHYSGPPFRNPDEKRTYDYVPQHKNAGKHTKLSNNKVGKAAQQMIGLLNELDAWVYHANPDGCSVYIKFKDSRMGSLRISDHPAPKSKYRYRWNLIINTRLIPDSTAKRFYFAKPRDAYAAIATFGERFGNH